MEKFSSTSLCQFNMYDTDISSIAYVLLLHLDPILLTQDPNGSVFFRPEWGEGYIRTNLF